MYFAALTWAMFVLLTLCLFLVFVGYKESVMWILAVPEGKDENTELEVYNFTGEGGVALSMYNTDEVEIWKVLSGSSWSLFCLLLHITCT